MSLVGKPLLLDRLDAELAPRVAELIAEDNERARQRREARAKRRADQASRQPRPPRLTRSEAG